MDEYANTYIYIYVIIHVQYLFELLRLAMLAALKLRPGSLGVLAPVCSSFGFLCVSQSGRCFENPLGNRDVPWVAASNVMAARRLQLQKNRR